MEISHAEADLITAVRGADPVNDYTDPLKDGHRYRLLIERTADGRWFVNEVLFDEKEEPQVDVVGVASNFEEAWNDRCPTSWFGPNLSEQAAKSIATLLDAKVLRSRMRIVGGTDSDKR